MASFAFSGPGSSANQRFPRGLTTLGFSWLPGRIAAVAVQRGEVVGSWSREDVPDDLARLGDYVREAVRATEYRGSTLSLMLAHPRLTHQLIETAPAKGAVLRSMVGRQVDRMKTFEGAAAFSFETTAGSQNPQSVLVHLLPQVQLDQLVHCAERAGLHLISVIPPTAVLHAQLARLPIGDGDVALIAADCGDRLTVVVGRKNGQLLLARSIDVNRSRGASGLAVDLSRTMLFVSQQFGVAVGSLWLFGPGAADRVTELQPQFQAPVQVSPEPERPSYWAEEGLRLPPDFRPNLISNELQRAPQHQTALRITTVVSAVLVCLAVASSAWVQVLSLKERKQIQILQRDIVALQAEHVKLQRSHELLERQELAIKQVVDDRLPPVPAYLLAYLGQVVPPDLRLTEVSVKREGDLWRLRLGGVAQAGPRGRSSTNASVTAGVAILSQSLTNGPFYVRLANAGFPVSTASSAESRLGAIANWAARRTLPTAAPKQTLPRDRFLLEGWMK